MIIVNGTLQVIEKKGGGMLNGIPIKVEESISEPIPCNLRTIMHNHKGKTVDGVFTQSSYEVLIESQQISAERVILTDSRNVRLGEFRVQDIQFLDFVNAVKIIV